MVVISDVKLGQSPVAVIHAEARRYSYSSVQRAYFPCIMHGISSSWPPDSRSPASPLSAAEHSTDRLISPTRTSLVPNFGLSRQVEGASRHPYCDLLLKVSPVRVGCPNQEPCPVELGNSPLPWAPLPGLDHPHSEFFFIPGGNLLCSYLWLLSCVLLLCISKKSLALSSLYPPIKHL